jgi:hypothetical protein
LKSFSITKQESETQGVSAKTLHEHLTMITQSEARETRSMDQSSPSDSHNRVKGQNIFKQGTKKVLSKMANSDHNKKRKHIIQVGLLAMTPACVDDDHWLWVEN